MEISKILKDFIFEKRKQCGQNLLNKLYVFVLEFEITAFGFHDLRSLTLLSSC